MKKIENNHLVSLNMMFDRTIQQIFTKELQPYKKAINEMSNASQSLKNIEKMRLTSIISIKLDS